jgi:hypothetical protein
MPFDLNDSLSIIRTRYIHLSDRNPNEIPYSVAFAINIITAA